MIVLFKYYWLYFIKFSWMMYIVIFMYMIDLCIEFELYFLNVNREYGFWSRNYLMVMFNLIFCFNFFRLFKRLIDVFYENIVFDNFILWLVFFY